MLFHRLFQSVAISGSLSLVISCDSDDDVSGGAAAGGRAGNLGTSGSAGSTAASGSAGGSAAAGVGAAPGTGGTTGGTGGTGGAGGAMGGTGGAMGGTGGTGGATGGTGGTGGATGGTGGTAGTTTGGVGGSTGGAGGSIGGAGGSAGAEPGVRCGNDTCDPATEICGGARPPTPAISCRPKNDPPCVGGCLVVGCDGPEDCAAGEVCLFTLGENHYLRCARVETGYGTLCSNDADCAPAFPSCADITGVGAWVEGLGWQPRACGP